MTTPSALAPKVNSYLNTLGVYISIDFITQCLEFIEEELGQEYKRKSEKQLQEMVFNVFLDENLHEIGVKGTNVAHPFKNILEMHDKRIKGPAVLQVDKIVDVSKPTEEQVDLDATDLLDEEDENDGVSLC